MIRYPCGLCGRRIKPNQPRRYDAHEDCYLTRGHHPQPTADERYAALLEHNRWVRECNIRFRMSKEQA